MTKQKQSAKSAEEGHIANENFSKHLLGFCKDDLPTLFG